MNVRTALRRFRPLLLLALLVACGRQAAPPDAPAPAALRPQAATASDLFFSEYVEGSSNNKALEIYNGTGADVDLGAEGYAVLTYSNGSPDAGRTIELTGTLAAGGTFVLADTQAAPEVLDRADLAPYNGFFNGDDALVLAKGGTVVDAFGQIGVDPGSQWGSGAVGTANATLRRKASVCAGDADPNDPFDPSAEWEGFGTDAFDGLGTHAVACDGDDGGDPDPAPAGAALVVNEVDYDQDGTDAAEFVELKNVSGAPVALSGHAVELVNGNGGTVYATIELPEVTLPAGGYYVICGDLAAVPNCDLDAGAATNLIQNGAPDGVALRAGGTVIDAVSYEGDLAAPYVEGAGTSVADPGDRDGVGLSRVPDGADSDRNDVDFRLCPITPGAANACEEGEDPGEPEPGLQCGAAATPISAIQGTGAESPLAGTTVAIEGIVVGDFQEGDGDPFGTDLGGFFVQEEEADRDDDPATSEGIFVHAPRAQDLSVGQVVRASGRVTEYFDLTEITDVGEVVVCGTAEPLPTDVELPVDGPDALERYEGMLVRFPQELVIAEYFDFDRYGEIVLALPQEGLDRPFQPTAWVEPEEAPEVAEENALRRILLDDGRTVQNPHPARHPNGEPFALDNRFRGGDVVANAVGVLAYDHGRYRLQPTGGAAHEATNPRPDAPDPGGELRVASFNVLNYFTTLGSRGADTAEEFERQRAKIVAALAAIDADVVGLIEIENRAEALADLVDALNDAAGAGAYAAIETGAIGGDEIRVALVYKPDAVAPVGAPAVLDDEAFLDPAGTGEAKNRPALAQTFARPDGAALTVVVNHLKSKGSGCGAGDDDPVQGNCTLTRTLAAEALLAWLATDPTGAGDPDVLLLGDYNAYDEEAPIAVLEAGFDGAAGSDDDVVDLLEAFEGEFAYSYVFDGQFGHLDYALATPSLAAQATGALAWRINADEPDLLDYDTTFKPVEQHDLYEPTPYRSSDHDPIVVGLDLVAPPRCADARPSVASLWPANHDLVRVAVEGFDEPVEVTIDGVLQDEPVDDRGDGATAPDAVLGADGTVELRAERRGGGDGRVYHVAFTAANAGGACSGEVLVGVPANQGRNGAAVDGGALHDATGR